MKSKLLNRTRMTMITDKHFERFSELPHKISYKNTEGHWLYFVCESFNHTSIIGFSDLPFDQVCIYDILK